MDRRCATSDTVDEEEAAVQIQQGTYRIGGTEVVVERDGYLYALVVNGERLRFNENGYPIEEPKESPKVELRSVPRR